jgi:hypothetical protein
MPNTSQVFGSKKRLTPDHKVQRGENHEHQTLGTWTKGVKVMSLKTVDLGPEIEGMG